MDLSFETRGGHSHTMLLSSPIIFVGDIRARTRDKKLRPSSVSSIELRIFIFYFFFYSFFSSLDILVRVQQHHWPRAFGIEMLAPFHPQGRQASLGGPKERARWSMELQDSQGRHCLSLARAFDGPDRRAVRGHDP